MNFPLSTNLNRAHFNNNFFLSVIVILFLFWFSYSFTMGPFSEVSQPGAIYDECYSRLDR